MSETRWFDREATAEARVCLKCGRTEVGWRYNRCPNCGEMADDQPLSLTSRDTEIHALKAQVKALEADRSLDSKRLDWLEANKVGRDNHHGRLLRWEWPLTKGSKTRLREGIDAAIQAPCPMCGGSKSLS